MIQSVGQYITELSITYCEGLNLRGLLDTLELCPELKKLEYENDIYCTTHIHESIMNCGKVYKTKVEDLCIHVGYSPLINDDQTNIFKRFPQLRILDLRVKNIHIGAFYDALDTHCPHLENLTLSINITLYETPSFTGAIKYPLQKFAVISNSCVRGFKDAITNRTLSRPRKFHLFKLPDVKERDIACIISECTQLEHLVIDNYTNVTDYLMNSFSTRNQIKTIDVSYCSGITSDGLTELIKRQDASLEKLVITGCDYIEEDVVTWAIEQLGEHVVKY